MCCGKAGRRRHGLAGAAVADRIMPGAEAEADSLAGLRLLREAGGTLALKVGSAGLEFFSAVLLARLLGARGYGVYAYALSLVTLLAVPAHAGLPNLVVRETARGLAQGRPDWLSGVWRWAGRVAVSFSAAVALVAGPVLVAWQGGLASLQGLTVAWALTLIPMVALGNLRAATLIGLQRVLWGQLPESVIRPAALVALLGSCAVFGIPLSPASAMALHVLASVVSFAGGGFLLRYWAPEEARRAAPAVASREWAVSGGTFALLAGLTVLNNHAGTLILGILSTPEAVASYRVAAQAAAAAGFGLQAANAVLAPRFAELWVRRQFSQLQRLARRSARMVLLFNLGVCVVFVIAGRALLRLVFGVEFGSAYTLLLVLLGGQVVNSAVGPAAFLLNMTGHERDTGTGKLAGVGLNIVLNLVAVPELGGLGAALAAASSTAAWNLLLWWKVRRRLGIEAGAFEVPGGRVGAGRRPRRTCG